MPISRPIGHIAGNLVFAALHVSRQIKQLPTNALLACWLADDGCIYAHRIDHPAARAIQRTAPQQIINRYRRQPGFGWRDVHDDLLDARADFATHAMAEARRA